MSIEDWWLPAAGHLTWPPGNPNQAYLTMPLQLSPVILLLSVACLGQWLSGKSHPGPWLRLFITDLWSVNGITNLVCNIFNACLPHGPLKFLRSAGWDYYSWSVQTRSVHNLQPVIVISSLQCLSALAARLVVSAVPGIHSSLIQLAAQIHIL